MTNKIHIVHLLIVFSFLYISNISYTQNEAIQFEHLTVKDGLSQNHVTSILKDSKGFMWFCTQNGLNRYDGKSFKVYKHSPDDPKSLSNNHVQAIYEDKKG
ncbi:MAG: two-component regulator propeller domain-containing protein, partial [Ignavibacteriaceae bacterium]